MWVFPTDVGMNRPDRIRDRSPDRIPHGCGDEPQSAPLAVQLLHVFPTDVGMNRIANQKGGVGKSIPHGCGDEP